MQCFLGVRGHIPHRGPAQGGRLSPPAWLPVPCRAEGMPMPGIAHPKAAAQQGSKFQGMK